MRFKTAFAQMAEHAPEDNALAAVRKIQADFSEISPACIVFFAATDYEPATLAAAMQAAFPDAVTLGCTSCGEAHNEKMLNRSVVAMAFSDEVFAFSETAVVLADAGAAQRAALPDVFSDATSALEYLGRNLGTPLIDVDYREYIGFVLADTTVMDFCESVVERAGDLMNAYFVGGVSGDDYKFDGSQAVFYKGKAYTGGAAVLALWKPAKGFALLKTQAVEVTDRQFLITKADEKARIVWEFDGRPALDAYAEAVGVTPEKMGSPEFDDNPLALVVNGEPFICIAVQPVDGKGLQLYCQVREGTRLTVTKAKDIVKKTGEAMAAKRKELGNVLPSAVLHINCCSRHTAMGRIGQDRLDEFGRLFARVPHAGFSSYGEVYINRLADTSVMLLFK